MSFTVEVDFPQPPSAVYAYLSDPTKRPEWQSSLRRIDDLDGTGDVGTSWYDVTTPGLKPHMSVTVAEPGLAWAEHGTWRGVVADLRLDLTPRGDGTRVVATVSIELPGVLRLGGRVLERLAPPAVRHDLRRAAAHA